MCKNTYTKAKFLNCQLRMPVIFPKKPNELDLINLEERFISPVMAFMLIHQLFSGGQSHCMEAYVTYPLK